MFPKLRENVWHVNPAQAAATLITSRETFQVPTPAALAFLKIRTYLTGHHSMDVVADKSGVGVADIQALLRSLEPAGIVYYPGDPDEKLSPAQVRDALQRASVIWGRELKMSYIGNEFVAGELTKSVLIGWLVEMYHYISDFPYAIEYASQHATGALKEVLKKYAAEEMGHECFVLDTLANLGISRAEVESSAPLLSTRLIGLLMRELFKLEPASVLIVATIIEAQEFDEDQIEQFKATLQKNYDLIPGALDPYFKHQEIDVSLGHAQMLAAHLDLIQITDQKVLDQVVNKIHDLKHAFDLQGLEIKNYFSAMNGKYFPRQPVSFESI